MEFVKKVGVWIAAVILIVSSILFYLLVVKDAGRKRAEHLQEIEARRDKLGRMARKGKETKGPEWVEYAEKQTKIWEKERNELREFVVRQPRRAQTRWFYDDEFGAVRTEIRERSQWLNRYEKATNALREVAGRSRKFAGISLSFQNWGGKLPQDWEIQKAQTEFWFQKDMVDLLTYNEPNVINDILAIRKDKRLPDLFAVVRNPQPEEPSARLRFAAAETLRSALIDILTAPNGCDLRVILSRYEMEVEGEKKNLWQWVYDLTFSAPQKAFVDALATDEHVNLVTFIMDLRTVRFRSDLLGLLRKHLSEAPNELGVVIKYLETPTPALERTLRREIGGWEGVLVADVIGYAVSLVDERDFELVLENHRPPVLAIGFACHRDKPDLWSEGVNGYIPFPFDLRVTMEFQKFPVFWRRLMTSDWRIAILELSRVEKSSAGAVESDTADGSVPRPDMRMGMELEEPIPGEEKDEDVTRVEAMPQRIVTFTMKCEGRLFLPLAREAYPEWKERIPEPKASLREFEYGHPGGEYEEYPP